MTKVKIKLEISEAGLRQIEHMANFVNSHPHIYENIDAWDIGYGERQWLTAPINKASYTKALSNRPDLAIYYGRTSSNRHYLLSDEPTSGDVEFEEYGDNLLLLKGEGSPLTLTRIMPRFTQTIIHYQLYNKNHWIMADNAPMNCDVIQNYITFHLKQIKAHDRWQLMADTPDPIWNLSI